MITTPNDLLTISQLRAELKAAKAEREQFGKVHLALNSAVCDIVEERDALRAALRDVLDCPECHGTGAVATGSGFENCDCVPRARRVLGEDAT